jgi:3-phosphoshikimate 1-carboxyvinyltransferase
MAEGTSIIKYPLESDDTRAAINAAEVLGATVRKFDDFWEIHGCGGKFKNPGAVIDMLNSGTSLRLFFASAARQDFPVSFDGDESLRTRRMSTLMASLEQLGCRCSSENGKCPVTVCGPVKSGRADVDGESSQFLSALLFALPFAEGEFELDLELLNERPYVGITLSWLDFLGIKYETSPDWLH